MRNFLMILLLFAALHADEEYQLGEGAQLGSLPIYLGGYISLDFRKTDDETRYRIDDVAVLGYGNYDKFSYLAELEFKNFYSRTYDDSDSSPQSSQDRTLYIERLYCDYNYNENYKLHVGKYNSPIGFWNLLPINVLRETSSSPVSSSVIFPSFTTGATATYSNYGEGEFTFDIMVQHNNDLDSDYNNYEMDKHYGVGITYAMDDFTVKFNGGYFHKQEEKEHTGVNKLYYFLASSKYESDTYQFLAEIGSQRSQDEITTDYAGYVQGLYRFTEKHIGVVRLESYKGNFEDFLDEEMAVVGYTYRPLYPIAFKSEYQFHSHSEANKMLFSLSVLF